jgi:pyruvate dehydrogenase E2 component (dihydrolipoamide acetyltransferase)
MPRDILAPRISDTTEEGVLVTWFVEPGATVNADDRVAEVQVEKISAEVLAPAGGRIARLLVDQGDVIVQGHPIAVLEEVERPVEGPVEGPVERPSAQAPVSAPPAVAPVPPVGRAVAASPVARRVAVELGIDLGSVVGTGPDGRIVEADVRAAAGPGLPRVGLVALSPMRRAIAERMRSNLLETAQLTLTAEADVTTLAELLAEARARSGQRATYTAAAVRASGLALRQHPRLGATWTAAGLRLPSRIDIGVAIALDDGLIVPVVRDAAEKSLEQLDREIADLAERARSARLAEAETQGAVFSVTNLGGYRIDAFTPLLNPPEAAILGLGRARPRPAVVDGSVGVRTQMVVSLTFDHRVVDGAPAAAFLDEIIAALEDPHRLR